MRKSWVIFLLLTFLNANTAFGEVLKLPMLIHHFVEHAQGGNDSVLDFLAKHYKDKNGHNHQNSPNDHEKLPFKTADGHFSSVVSIAPLIFIEVSQISTILPSLKIPAYSQQIYTNPSLNSVWEPPRFG